MIFYLKLKKTKKIQCHGTLFHMNDRFFQIQNFISFIQILMNVLTMEIFVNICVKINKVHIDVLVQLDLK